MKIIISILIVTIIFYICSAYTYWDLLYFLEMWKWTYEHRNTHLTKFIYLIITTIGTIWIFNYLNKD